MGTSPQQIFRISAKTRNSPPRFPGVPSKTRNSRRTESLAFLRRRATRRVDFPAPHQISRISAKARNSARRFSPHSVEDAQLAPHQISRIFAKTRNSPRLSSSRAQLAWAHASSSVSFRFLRFLIVRKTATNGLPSHQTAAFILHPSLPLPQDHYSPMITTRQDVGYRAFVRCLPCCPLGGSSNELRPSRACHFLPFAAGSSIPTFCIISGRVL